MTARDSFLTVIYLWLTFTSLVNGQYFSGSPRSSITPQSKPSGNVFTHPPGPQNLFSPEVPSPGLNPNFQRTNPQNMPGVPDMSSFPSRGLGMPDVSDFRSLFPRGSSSIPRQWHQPTSFAPQDPNLFGPPRQTSSFPRQTRPFNTGREGFRSNTNPLLADPFIAHLLETNPFFTEPRETDSFFTRPQQRRPLSPHPTALMSTIPESINPSTLRYHSNNPGSTGPQQSNPSTKISQQSKPDTSPQQDKPSSTSPEQSYQDSTGPQQTYPDSTSPQQTNSDSASFQQTDSDMTPAQNANSDSTGPKTNPISDDAQPISTESEASSSTGDRSGSTGHLTSYTSEDPDECQKIVCISNSIDNMENGFSLAQLDPGLCTHVNVEFAILDPNTYEMTMSESEIEMNSCQEAVALKKVNPKLKVMMSLGGWRDSTKKYSELADDPAKRSNFIKKAIEFLQKYGLDGLDLAWEYPNCWQGDIGVNPKDKPNFVALLKEMKKEFRPCKLLLSVSVGAIKREVEAAYDVPEISKHVDYINVMTYDMHGPWESKTSHHVQFEAMPGDADPYCNVKGGMQVWLEKGADKRKLNMGIAFYGRTFRLQNSNQCGMGIPALGPGAPGPQTKEGGILNYNEICNYLNSGNWTEKEHKKVGFYACCQDQWVGYDPPMMIVRKVKHVAQSCLGGVLIKHVGADDWKGKCFNMPFPLLRMARMEMMHRQKCPCL